MRFKSICPKCRVEIPLDDINVAKDIALCRRCGETFSYGDLIDEANDTGINPANPPRGAWFKQRPPHKFEVGVSTRSAIAFFLVPFMCVWSGFSLGGIYGTRIVKGHFNLYISLFGIPFVLGTLLFGSIAIMSVCGKILVAVDGDKGVVFTGVGPIGWRRKFDWRSVTAIRRTQNYGNRGGSLQQITLEGPRRIDFASGVKQEKLDFMYGMLLKQWRESGH
jgi:hypothetical protein